MVYYYFDQLPIEINLLIKELYYSNLKYYYDRQIVIYEYPDPYPFGSPYTDAEGNTYISFDPDEFVSLYRSIFSNFSLQLIE